MSMIKIQLPPKVHTIIKTLQEHGFEAYAVGGCVRDSILGREPEDWGHYHVRYAGRDEGAVSKDF